MLTIHLFNHHIPLISLVKGFAYCPYPASTYVYEQDFCLSLKRKYLMHPGNATTVPMEEVKRMGASGRLNTGWEISL